MNYTSTRLPRKSVLLTKKEIRSKILGKLKRQKEEERERKSKIIQKKLFRTAVFKKAKRIMFYISFGGEVNTERMIKKTQDLGKTVAVPVCTKNNSIRPCLLLKNSRLIKGRYGIYEPAIKRFIRRQDLDLVITPGVAFDKKGRRLGRGKGCYDYFLKRLPKRIPALGLAFDFQILPIIPATKRDVRINRVLFT